MASSEGCLYDLISFSCRLVIQIGHFRWRQMEKVCLAKGISISPSLPTHLEASSQSRMKKLISSSCRETCDTPRIVVGHLIWRQIVTTSFTRPFPLSLHIYRIFCISLQPSMQSKISHFHNYRKEIYLLFSFTLGWITFPNYKQTFFYTQYPCPIHFSLLEYFSLTSQKK